MADGSFSTLPSKDTDAAATQLDRQGGTWGSGATVTWAARTTGATYTDTGGTLNGTSFKQLTDNQITYVQHALDTWSDLANITFSRVEDGSTKYSNSATMLFGNYTVAQQPSGAFAHFPTKNAADTSFAGSDGDVWFNDDHNNKDRPLDSKGKAVATEGFTNIENPTYGSQEYGVIYMHEIGHALGLSHPADYNSGTLGTQPTYEKSAIYREDSNQYTIMSYFDETKTGLDYTLPADTGVTAATRANYTNIVPMTPMLDDIAAIQAIYGANMNTRTGDNTYGFNSDLTDHREFSVTAESQKLVMTIWDAGGDDTLDFSGYSDKQLIDLNAEHFSSVGGLTFNVAIAKGVTIENAIGGSGVDYIIGNDADNELTGNGGNDILRGGAGNDRLDGGAGTNIIDGGAGTSDAMVFDHSGYYYTRTHNNDGSITFTGTGEAAGEKDTVSNVENYSFESLPTGITKALAPTGGNHLVAQDDAPSTFVDLSGTFLNGLDFFGHQYSGVYINNNGNITFGGGLSQFTPSVIASGSQAIIAPFWADVDTRPSGGGVVWYNADAAHGTFTVTWQNVGFYSLHADKLNTFQLELVDEGSGDFDIIFRYSAVNWDEGDFSGGQDGINGGHPARAGFSAGDAGLGHYFELPQSGNEAGMLNIENAVGNSGSAGAWLFRVSNGVIDGIGDSGDNTLNGNDKNNSIFGAGGNDTIDGMGGNDTLYGGDGDDQITGGAGNDKMYGGAGNDNYIVLDTGDTPIENPGEGTADTVQAAINYILPDAKVSEVENLVLIGNALTGTGNTLNNLIIGNNLANTINGGDGDDTLDGGVGDDKINGQNGNDTLLGGAGNDKYDGGAGFDIVQYNNAVTLDLKTPANNTGDAHGDTFLNIEMFYGSDSVDLLVGSNGNDSFYGRGGDDTINGGSGNDGIEGGAGNDSLNGGDGIGDTVSYQHSSSGITITLQKNLAAIVHGGDAEGDTVTNFENVTGSQFDDVMIGDSNGNYFQGLGGNDMFTASFGVVDKFDGGAGSDTVDYSASTGDMTIVLDVNGNGTGKGELAGGDTYISIENIKGGDGNDTLTGNASANKLTGNGGNDTIKGGGGGDTLDGGVGGLDTLDYSWASAAITATLGESAVQTTTSGASVDKITNFENITGGSGDDNLTGNSTSNIIHGGAGNDTIEGGDSSDQLFGDAGTNDTVSYAHSAGGVTINLKLLGPQAVGGDGTGDTLSGFENIIGSGQADSLTGDNGNNIIEGGAGADTIAGGTGNDTASYGHSSAGITLMLGGSNQVTGHGGDAEGDLVTGIENIAGSIYDDTFGGDANVNTLIGGAGNDTADYSGSTAAIKITLADDGSATGIGGSAQGDHLFLMENLTGGAFNDTLTGNAGVNVLHGGNGDDLLIGLGGGDTLDGGIGIDTVDYSASSQPVIVSLGTNGAETVGINGDAAGDHISNVENITGSKFGDILTGNELINVIHGGLGDDFIQGGDGADTLTGDGGIDTVSYAGSSVGVTVNINLAANVAQHGGYAEGDKLSGFENILGSSQDDTLTGTDGNNTIEGGLGADTMSGKLGNDTLSYNRSSDAVTVTLNGGIQTTEHGGDAEGDKVDNFENIIGSSHDDVLTGDSGANNIDGRAGADTITGGLGADILTGGAGGDANHFVYNSLAEKGDHITDFQVGIDKIDINVPGFQNLATINFSGSSNPTPPSGTNACFLYDTDNGQLFYDDDGTGAHAKVMLLTLDNHPTNFSASDLHLLT